MTPTEQSSDADRNHQIRQANLRNAAEHEAHSPHERSKPAFKGRWTRHQWGHASLFATLGALVVALVPGFDNAMQVNAGPSAMTSMALPLPPAKPRDESSLRQWQLVTVEQGETLGSIFNELGVPATTLNRIMETPETQKALARLRPGTELAFDMSEDEGLRAFRFEKSSTERVLLSITDDGIDTQIVERPVEVQTRVVSGEIINTLYGSAQRAGLSPRAIHTMTDRIFQYDIDFSREIQTGDRFSVVVEELWREGERIGNGEVVAATFSTGGKTYSGFRFEHDGKMEYYSADGRPLKRSFIRSPIEFARLSSNFGNRRHPVLGTMRMHKGVDYAARTGTPIMAAGEGRVQFRGWQNGYGNTVIIDHGRGQTTLYAHMSRFANNVRQGQRVSQGQVIGHVGATGLATGPHLHYEFRVNGVHRNPLTVTLPPPEPLQGPALVAFRAQTAPALAQIQQYEDLFYATVPPAPENGRELASAGTTSGPRG